MLRRPRPDPAGPGEESVWDYPRPPRLEPQRGQVRIVLGGVEIAASDQALRVLETSHPPTVYVPRADIRVDALAPGAGGSVCEWKGAAAYLDVRGGDRVEPAAAWTYPTPTPAFAALAGHIAFYPSRMDACYVGDERVTSQAGDFYGGWVTANLRGPMKGDPGTWGW